MADNLNPNQNPKPVQSKVQNSPSVPVSQPASPSPAKPAPPNLKELFELFGNNKGLLVGLFIALLVLVAATLYGPKLWQKIKPPASVEQKQEWVELKGQQGGGLIPVNAFDPAESPPQLPVIKQTDSKANIEAYFTRVSPSNFKKEFMNQVSELAAKKYSAYIEASIPEQKEETARNFYIYLDSPGPYRSDPSFSLFLKDVKADLEKAVGKPIL